MQATNFLKQTAAKQEITNREVADRDKERNSTDEKPVETIAVLKPGGLLGDSAHNHTVNNEHIQTNATNKIFAARGGYVMQTNVLQGLLHSKWHLLVLHPCTGYG